MTDPEQTRWAGGHVTCPACGREGYTDALLNLCGNCSRWFVVDPETDVTAALLEDVGVLEADDG